MPNPRRSPEIGTWFSDISRKNSAPAELTEYIPSIGNLSEPQTPEGLPDLEEKDRAAALPVASQGERSEDEHIALLDRVLLALRRL